MASSPEYDVLIMAYSPGGWAAAVALAQAGRKVAIIDRTEIVPGRLIPREGIWARLLPAVATRLPREEKVFQFVLPGHRFVVPGDHHAFLSELSQEFPELEGVLPPSFARMAEVGRTFADYFFALRMEWKRPEYRIRDGRFFENLLQWRHYQRVRHLSRAGLDQENSRSAAINSVLESPVRFGTGLFGNENEEGIGAVSAYFRQGFFPLTPISESRVGLIGLKEVMPVLRGFARDLKVETLNPIPESSSETEGAPEAAMPAEKDSPRFELAPLRQLKKGVEFHRWREGAGRRSTSFRGLIWTGNAAEFLNSLPSSQVKTRGARRLSRNLAGLAVSHFFDTLKITAPQEVIPVGMEKKVFFVADPGQDLTDENLISLTVSREGQDRGPEEGVDSAGSATISIQAVVPRSTTRPAEEVKLQVLKRIYWLIPFLKDFQLGEPVWERGEESKASGARVYRINRGGREKGLTIPVGWAGIFYAGEEMFPVLGPEGDLLSGLAAGFRLEKWLRRF